MADGIYKDVSTMPDLPRTNKRDAGVEGWRSVACRGSLSKGFPGCGSASLARAGLRSAALRCAGLPRGGLRHVHIQPPETRRKQAAWVAFGGDGDRDGDVPVPLGAVEACLGPRRTLYSYVLYVPRT